MRTQAGAEGGNGWLEHSRDLFLEHTEHDSVSILRAIVAKGQEGLTRDLPQVGGDCSADAKKSCYDERDVNHGCRLTLSSLTSPFKC